jgi:hypothetical protein
MPAPLQDAIEDAFSRKQSKLFMDRMTLKGFRWRGEETFPKEWEIVTKRWFETDAEEDMRRAELPDFDNLGRESEASDENWGYFSADAENSPQAFK